VARKGRFRVESDGATQALVLADWPARQSVKISVQGYCQTRRHAPFGTHHVADIRSGQHPILSAWGTDYSIAEFCERGFVR
jgi:hypothetical protein